MVSFAKVKKNVKICFLASLHFLMSIFLVARARWHWLELCSRLPKGCRIGWSTDIWGSKNIFVEDYTTLAPHSIISTCLGSPIPNMSRQEGYIKIGGKTVILPYAQIHSWGGFVEIGAHCSLHSYSIIYGAGGVRIGSEVRIAANTLIIASMHNYESTEISIYRQGCNARGITIEDDVWIGAGVVILDGVKIGKGSIIGAGAVVNRDVAPYTIVAGVPSRLINKRL